MTVPVRQVRSTDGVSLAVYEAGDPAAATLVAIHGYPDNHTVWDGLVAILADRFHVVTYDVRGAGDSGKPARRAAYRIPQLVDDFAAVLEATVPDGPVHVLGHDWGSIQGWSAITDPRLAGRIASYTSISGPGLDYAGPWMRDLRAHPRAALSQFAHSYYIALFQLPVLPDLAARRGLITRSASRAGAGAERVARTSADALHGIQLYRANMFGRLGRPRPAATEIPVLVIAPEDDPFLSPQLQFEAPAPYVSDLTTRLVPGGHWVVSANPGLIAQLVTEFVDAPERAAL